MFAMNPTKNSHSPAVMINVKRKVTLVSLSPHSNMYRIRTLIVRLPKLECSCTTVVLDVTQLELLKLLARVVKVQARDVSALLVEADVVESGKACAGDAPDLVVGDQEALFPPHKDVFALDKRIAKVLLASHLCERLPGRKAAPVLNVAALTGAPVPLLCEERVLLADDFAFKVGGEGGVVLSEALDAEVAAEKGFVNVDVLEVDRDLVRRPARLLGADEP